MKVIVTYSGGKDSQASLLWTLNNLTKTPIVVFCDTGWEHELTYKHIEETTAALGLELITLRSKKYDGMVDLARKKKRFPSTRNRFCTIELKTTPMIDYILDVVKDDFIVVQGIRAAESPNRALMESQCNYFKYYLQPIETNTTRRIKIGKQLTNPKLTGAKRRDLTEKLAKVEARLAKGKEDPKYHTYRRREVLAYCKKYATDVLRPVFDKSGQWVINYILDNGQQPNPLYKMSYKRVGCYPCIMASQQDILNIVRQNPEHIAYIGKLEAEIGSSFFGPDKIPIRAFKGSYPLIADVTNYITWLNATGSLFDDETATSCMSFYGLCE